MRSQRGVIVGIPLFLNCFHLEVNKLASFVIIICNFFTWSCMSYPHCLLLISHKSFSRFAYVLKFYSRFTALFLSLNYAIVCSLIIRFLTVPIFMYSKVGSEHHKFHYNITITTYVSSDERHYSLQDKQIASMYGCTMWLETD